MIEKKNDGIQKSQRMNPKKKTDSTRGGKEA